MRVKLFAVARQLAGADVVDLTLSASPTVAELREALLERLPGLEPLRATLRFAVNNDYVGEQFVIPKEAEVACIPPVSGG